MTICLDDLGEETLEAFMETALYADVELMSNYSGRGMYGDQCVGITGDMRSFVKFILELSDRINQSK